MHKFIKQDTKWEDINKSCQSVIMSIVKQFLIPDIYAVEVIDNIIVGLDTSEYYHNNLDVINHIDNAIDESRMLYFQNNKKEYNIDSKFNEKEWPDFFGVFNHKYGTLKFLTKQIDLLREGEVMNHCVGSYVSQASSASSFIAHIQGNNCQSTIELKLINNIFVIVQHYSKSNTSPTKELEEIANSFLKEINKNNQEIIVEIKERQNEYNKFKNINSVFYTSKALKCAMPYIKNILPRRFRKKSLEKLINMIDESDINN